MNIEKSKFPLAFLKEWMNFRKELDKIVLDNEDVVQLIEDDNTLKIVDKKTSEDFYFLIKDLSYKQSNTTGRGLKAHVSFQRRPASHVSIDVHISNNYELEKIPNVILKWIKLLSEYSNIHLTREEEYIHQYQEQYFQEFEIIDDDSYENPFELQKQLLLHSYLKSLINFLERKQDEYEVDEVITETNQLMINIQNYSKKKVIKDLSKLFAKMQAKNLELIKDEAIKVLVSILKTTYEAGIKALIETMYKI
jgi:hypothetical protein